MFKLLKILSFVLAINLLFFVEHSKAEPKIKLRGRPFVKILERGKPSFVDLSSSVSGGKKPYVFSTETLPPGLSLSPDGMITGAPDYSAFKKRVRISVQDAKGRKAIFNPVIKTIGESYDLAFTQDAELRSCFFGTRMCSTVTFTATNIGNSPPLDRIQIEVPSLTQAGVAVLKSYENLNLENAQSYTFAVDLPVPGYSFLEVVLSSSYEIAGTTKSYSLNTDLQGGYVVTAVKEN